MSDEPALTPTQQASATLEADLIVELPDMPLEINTTGSVGLTPPGSPQTMLYIETEKPQ